MTIVVNDTNILIDLIELDLIGVFFRIEWEFYTTDIIIETELNDKEQQQKIQPFLDSGILKIKQFDEAEILEMSQLQSEKTQLSIQDCSALLGAQKLGARLLTSDNKLRKFAVTKQVEVHGHLWIFDILVETGLISTQTAVFKLNERQNINKKLKLPTEECKIRIKRWNES